MRKLAIVVFISVVFGIILAAPRQERDANEMELLFDPGLGKEPITLIDDYGVRPIPPKIPPSLLQGQGTYQPNLEEEYY